MTPALTRRRLLAACAGTLAAGLAASDATHGGGHSALGGAGPDQPSVPVVDLLVILGDETHQAAGGAYEGVDWRAGGRLEVAPGDRIRLDPVHQ